MSDVSGEVGDPGSTARAEDDEVTASLLAPLEGLADRPVAEHPAAYEEVHGRLRAALAGDPAGSSAPQA